MNGKIAALLALGTIILLVVIFSLSWGYNSAECDTSGVAEAVGCRNVIPLGRDLCRCEIQLEDGSSSEIIFTP